MAVAQQLSMSASEFLAFQRSEEHKYQFIDGDAYAMAGGTEEHNIISLNIASELRHLLKGSDCKPFMADMMLKAGGNYFYPDVMVVCDSDKQDDSYLKHAPTLIVEVLSKSSRQLDLTRKKLSYINIPSLQEYLLIEQSICEVQVCRRKDNWASSYHFLGDEIMLDSLNVSLKVADIYQGIQNANMTEYLETLASQSN